MVLEKGKRDQRHHHVPVQPSPRAAFEIIETEFLFQIDTSINLLRGCGGDESGG